MDEKKRRALMIAMYRKQLEASPYQHIPDISVPYHRDIFDAILSGTTALHEVRLLVGSGANVNSVNIHGDTPLLMAIRFCHYDLIVYLIRRGANLNVSGTYSPLPLWLAIERGDLAMVKFLIAQGCKVDQPTHCERHRKYSNLMDFIEKQYHITRYPGERCLIFDLTQIIEICDVLMAAGHPLPRHPTVLLAKYFK